MTIKSPIAFKPPCLPYLNLGSINKNVIVARIKETPITAILKDVNCHISENSICGFVGNNGSGKTVLFKCILGFYYQDSGQIFINGKERTKKDGILTDAVALGKEYAAGIVGLLVKSL